MDLCLSDSLSKFRAVRDRWVPGGSPAVVEQLRMLSEREGAGFFMPNFQVRNPKLIILTRYICCE